MKSLTSVVKILSDVQLSRKLTLGCFHASLPARHRQLGVRAGFKQIGDGTVANGQEAADVLLQHGLIAGAKDKTCRASNSSNQNSGTEANIGAPVWIALHRPHPPDEYSGGRVLLVIMPRSSRVMMPVSRSACSHDRHCTNNRCQRKRHLPCKADLPLPSWPSPHLPQLQLYQEVSKARLSAQALSHHFVQVKERVCGRLSACLSSQPRHLLVEEVQRDLYSCKTQVCMSSIVLE